MGGQNEIVLDSSNMNTVPNTDKIWNSFRMRVGRKIFLATCKLSSLVNTVFVFLELDFFFFCRDPCLVDVWDTHAIWIETFVQLLTPCNLWSWYLSLVQPPVSPRKHGADSVFKSGLVYFCSSWEWTMLVEDSSFILCSKSIIMVLLKGLLS